MDENIFKTVNKINVLFLDIDEVLNCNVSKYKDNLHKNVLFLGKNTHDRYLPALVNNMNNLISRYDLKIVISSTWRKHFDIITLRDILQRQLGLVGEVIDYTTKYSLDHDYQKRIEYGGDDAYSWERGLQITKWLSERKYNVNNYIVIDDGKDASYGHEDNYHRTEGKRGFDLDSYNECINKFDALFLKP